MQTQWRVGMSGAIGLDYNVVLHELDRKNLDKADYDEFFNDIQIMEVEALKFMSSS